MITIKNIQDRLREAIKTSTFTQKELAEKLNLHPTAVNKYLRDDVYPSFANLCQILDVSADEILGLKD